MSNNPCLPEKTLEIYAEIVYTDRPVSQSSIAKRLGITQSRVSRVITYLLKKRYIEEVLPSSHPKHYKKGSYCGMLDDEIRKVGFTPLCKNIALPDEPSTTSTKDDSNIVLTNSYLKAHRLALKCRVKTAGDITTIFVGTDKIAFMRPNKPVKGFRQWSGNLSFKNESYSIQYFESIIKPNETIEEYNARDSSYLMIYLPDQMLPVEIDDDPKVKILELKNIVASKGLEVKNHLCKVGRWELSDPEFTAWKPHLASEDDRLMGQIANRATGYSRSGKVVTSNSDGSSELEVPNGFDPEGMDLAIKMANIPELLSRLERTTGMTAGAIDKNFNSLLAMILKQQELVTRMVATQDGIIELQAKGMTSKASTEDNAYHPSNVDRYDYSYR